MAKHLTTREVADLLGVYHWRVMRLFSEGLLSEPARFAGRRVVDSKDLPHIVDALRQKDWLPDDSHAEAEAAQ